MCDVQKHGGPDDEGLYTDEAAHLVFGHRRLALIDLTPSGHQPMHYMDRYLITYNGEIYNYPELKKELEAEGAVFRTHCDTEVIMAAFHHWSTQSFTRLAGMYAFALYDRLKQSVYLVRDPSGIKPLYFSDVNGQLSFASEVRAFRFTQATKNNSKWPVYLLAYGHLPEPITTLEHVKPLHKGCFYKYDLHSNDHSLQSFQHYSFSSTFSSRKDAIEIVQQSLKRAVKRHLLADAPIGVFLSGGLDSGIVTVLAAEQQHESLQTLSLYFREQAYSEKNYQDGIIRKLNCHRFQHLLTEEEFHESLPNILDAMDMPGCDGLNTWFISKYAKARGLKAVLSGIGGDELFGGYPSFQRMGKAKLLKKLPETMLRSAKNGSAPFKRLPYLSIQGMTGMYLFLRGIFAPQEIAYHLDASEGEVWETLQAVPGIAWPLGLESRNEASWMELHLYMQNQLLRDADVMSMAHGIEIRIPFLDAEVIRAALSIQAGIKYSGQYPKQLLIDGFRNIIPEATWNRKKMGFTFPFADWMRKSRYLDEIMQTGSKQSRAGYKKFQEGSMHWSQVMALMHVEKSHQTDAEQTLVAA